MTRGILESAWEKDTADEHESQQRLRARVYCNLAYSDFVAMRTGMSGSASLSKNEEVLISHASFGFIALQRAFRRG